MNTPPQLTLLRPLYLLLLSAAYIPITLAKLLLPPAQPSKLRSWPAFQHAWFGTFWAYFGPVARGNAAAAVEPLLQTARGVVLDIGPGSGEWVYLFSAARNPAVERVYGVEPNGEHHAALRRRVAEAGLEGVYEVVGVGVEELGRGGLLAPGSVDTVCTVQVLCSVPAPRTVVKEVYPLLKKGGRWLVYEHVRTKYQNEFVGWWQDTINKVWPLFFDGCDICRPTDEWLLQAGDWETVALEPGKGEGKYDTIPHAIGTLVKR
ncbi:hypothetical protein MBLNU459_g3212t1 [Dothideomycetes sp. NU459]